MKCNKTECIYNKNEKCEPVDKYNWEEASPNDCGCIGYFEDLSKKVSK